MPLRTERRGPIRGRSDSRRLRLKTRRVAGALEKFLGVPQQKPVLPSPLEMLIATILSQNTNDKNSHRAYTKMRKTFRTWDSLGRAPLPRLVEAIRSGGMANQKAPRIKAVLAAVREQYGRYSLASLRSKSNEDVLEELTRLHGVGVKTASCVLLFSMRRDVFPVDTHVHRVCTRLGLAPGCRTPEKTFEAMRALVPEGKAYSLHTNLIRFGRKVCHSATPACSICPLYVECTFEGKRGRGPTRKTVSQSDHDFMLLDNV